MVLSGVYLYAKTHCTQIDIIGTDDGLLFVRRQALMWINTGLSFVAETGLFRDE